MCDASLSSVAPHQLRHVEHVSAHRPFQSAFISVVRRIDLGVKRVELKVIAVRFSGRRTRASVSNVVKTVQSLRRAARQRRVQTDAFFKSGSVRSQSPQDPVRESTHGCIGIIADEGQALRPLRHSAPLERWREVLSVAGVFFRNTLPVSERAAPDGHGSSRFPLLLCGCRHRC